jgi:hypothetical protein
MSFTTHPLHHVIPCLATHPPPPVDLFPVVTVCKELLLRIYVATSASVYLCIYAGGDLRREPPLRRPFLV